MRNMEKQSRMGSFRRLMAGGDSGGNDAPPNTDLPSFPDTCDHEYDNHMHTCDTISYEWSCNMTSVAGLAGALQIIQKVEADDCWADLTGNGALEAKCLDAPLGAQTCSFQALPAGSYATGMKVTVNGD